MLYTFTLHDQRLEQVKDADETAFQRAAWIDLLDPTEDERQRIEKAFEQKLPEEQAVEEIEATARFFEDESGLHLHSYFLHRQDGRIQHSTVAFTLRAGRLFTLHDEDLPAFRMFRWRARREPGLVTDAVSILTSLFETKVEELADVLEEVYNGLRRASTLVLEKQPPDLEEALDELARQEDINGKVRISLMDTQRALAFLLRRASLSEDDTRQVREMLRDIQSLLTHNDFLFQKVNFLMDAAQGFINIEQNQIIKIFSIAAVTFLPPTLIASIYGMNFQYMPELNWPWGYPLAIALMILSGIAPYWYFKHKGWL